MRNSTRKDASSRTTDPATPPILATYTDWLRQSGRSNKTRENYRGDLRRVASWLHANHGLGLLEADRDLIADWRAALTQGDQTVRNYIAAVRSFYRWAVLTGQIPVDPTLGLPVPKIGRRLPRPISEEALEYAIDTADERIRPWLILGAYAGLRCCEIARLERGRVHDTAADPGLYVIGKGDKERWVPLSDYVLFELRPILPRRGWLFTMVRYPHRRVSDNMVSKLCNQHLRDCGLHEKFHQLRHRFGTQVQRATRDLRVTQELLGHADPATTALYAQVANADAVAGVQAVQPEGRRLRSARRRPRPA